MTHPIPATDTQNDELFLRSPKARWVKRNREDKNKRPGRFCRGVWGRAIFDYLEHQLAADDPRKADQPTAQQQQGAGFWNPSGAGLRNDQALRGVVIRANVDGADAEDVGPR